MKKALSLFLALVMIATALCGLTMAAECAQEDAKVILTADKAYYYDALNSDVVSMANAYSGDVTIKLMSDIDITATLAFSKASGAVILDLNGYTINNGGSGTMIDVAEGTNLTVKNGYITNTANVTVITANKATLTLEKVMLRSDSTSTTGTVAAIDASGTVLTIKGSGIYQKSKNNYDTDPANAFNGALHINTVADVEESLTITESVIYNGGFRAIRLKDSYTGDVVINVTNSVLAAADASGSSHALILGYSSGAAQLIINGETIATTTGGALTLNEGEGGSELLTGSTYTYTFPGDITVNPYKAGLWGTAPSVMIPVTECAPEDAKVILTADKAYYYDALSSDVVSMANAYSGDVTIKLMSDIDITATLAFSKASGAVILDLNGYTINNGGSGTMIDVAEGTNLTVKNGYIINTVDAVTVITANNATLTLEKIMLQSDSTSTTSTVAAIDASGTVLTIQGSGIYQKSATGAHNGALHINTVTDVEESLTITDSVIYNGGFRVIRLKDSFAGDVTVAVENSVLAAADASNADNHAVIKGYTAHDAQLIINDETIAKASNNLVLTEGSGGSTNLTNFAYTYTFPGGISINPYKAGLWGTAPSLMIPFVVTYDANGGTGSIADQHSDDGNAVAILGADGLAYADHCFVGWNTVADGTGTAYFVSSNVEAGTTLYAQWCEWSNAETADSVVKVETNGTTYYSDMLHSVIADQVVDFGGTITLLKDYTLTQKVEFPASWDTAKAIVIDLNGHTITHVAGIAGSATAVRGLFTVLGGGDLTLKNGAVISTEDNSLVSLGWKGAENNLDGVPYLPKLTLDNMQMKQECEEINNCAMIISKNYKADITILNSTLWTLNNGTNAHFSALIMDGLADGYTSVLEIHDSVLGGPNVALVIRTDATGIGHKLELNTSSTKYVSSTGYIWREAAPELTATVNGNTLTADKAGSEASVDATLEENWTYTHAVFGELTGKATVYGIAAVKNETTGGKYYSLAKALAAAGNGETILLQKNIGGAPLVINTSITLNFATFTYTVNTDGDGASALTVANGTTVILKNGALVVDEAVASYFSTLIENQGADITIDTMTLSGANLDANAQVTDGYVSYVLANHNGGTVTIAGATNISANTKGTGYAFDVCSGTTVSVTTTGNINGYITVDKASGAKLTIESGTYDKALDNSWLKAGMVPTSNAAGTTFTVAEGTISNAGSSLSLNEWVHINQYVTFDETLAANVSLKDAGSGLLVWIGDTKIGDTAYNAANAVPFVVLNEGKYIAQSTGIDTPEYGKTVFMRAYVELADGSYAYGPVKEYSVRQYCNNMLASSASDDVKALCAALLNFGAASQTYFVRDTDALANAGVEYPVNAYSAEMVKDLATIVNNIGTEEITINTTMSLDAEIFHNFYIDATLASDTAPELYIWSGDTTTLTDKNYSKKVTMVLNQTGDLYHAQSDGFSSNEYNDTIFVAVKIGDTFYAAQGFSVANSAKKVIENEAQTEEFKALCESIIVYGNYAETVFG